MYPFIDLGGRTIGTYGLFMVIAVFLVAGLSVWRGRKYNLTPEDILIVGSAAVGIGLVGGSLLYIFVTYPIDLILSRIKAGDFAFLNGGIVFYGGLLGGLAGAFLGVRIAKCDFTALEYSVVPFVPLGHAVGRVGCVMAGCCYGFEYDGPFALHYPNAISGISPEQGYFPIQLMESVLNVVICVVLLLCAKKLHRRYDLLSAYLGCYGIARFVLEIFRGDEIRGIYFSLSLSQWISIGMMAFSLLWFVILRKMCREAKRIRG